MGDTDAWHAAIEQLRPVIDRCESITVSLYRFHPDAHAGGQMARWNAGNDFQTVSTARDLASGRRVLVFFLDAYHDGGTSPFAGDPIHVVEMQQAVRLFGHCGADVVVWWRQQAHATPQLCEYVIRSWSEAVAIEETGPPR